MYFDNEQKLVAVLNRNIPIPKLMNCLGHITVGLGGRKSEQEMHLLSYSFSADWATPATISRYPFIILEAKNNNQLKRLHQAANDIGILHNVFTDSMLGHSANEQMKQTKNTSLDDLIYFGVVLFGASVQLATLTKKFSLFKD